MNSMLQPYREKYIDARPNDLREALRAVGANHEFEQVSQLALMTYVGLKPHHKFLDLACGCLRGTALVADYLDEGNFHGADISLHILMKSLERLESMGISKKVILHHLQDYDFFKLMKTKFDFILSVSLFTHLMPDSVQPIFKGVSEILQPGGVYYFTMYPAKDQDFEGDVNVARFKKEWLINEGKKAGLKVMDVGVPGKDYLNPSPASNYIKRVNIPFVAQWVMKAIRMADLLPEAESNVSNPAQPKRNPGRQ